MTTASGSQVLRLNASLYPRESVESATNTLSDFGTFSIENDGDYITVSVQAGDDVDPVELVGELANFALANTLGGGSN